jgi:phosphohistidine phosphatase
MRCIIVRHGKAERTSETGRDEDRVLTARGRRQAEFLARLFAAPAKRPALILASRFERALTTAKIIETAAGCPLRKVPELEAGTPCSEAIELIARHKSSVPLMLVGHNPQLAELIGVLLHGLPVQEEDLRTGEAVALELHASNLVGTAKELARLRLEDED